MAIRIYFNQWFSSITQIIRGLKSATFSDSLYIVGSSLNKDHAYRKDCDKFILEKDFSYLESKEEQEQGYIRQIARICVNEKIDIFFVRKNAELIERHRQTFDDLGIHLVLEDREIFDIINSKTATYNKLSKDFSTFIPNYIDTKTLPDDKIREELHKTIQASGADGKPLWCFKLDTDEGGGSFRTIEPSTNLNFDSLKHGRYNKITKEEATELVNNCSIEELHKIIFMEKLISPELSVDCYNSKKGFIAICRQKIPGTRVQIMYHSDDMTEICRKIATTLNLKHIFNVQFMVDSRYTEKYSQIKTEYLKLLEINARMSGGSYYQRLLGLNLAEVYIRDITGDTDYNIEEYIKFPKTAISHIEHAFTLI